MNLGQAAAVVLYELGRGAEDQSAKLNVQSKPRKDNVEVSKTRSSAARRKKRGEEKSAPSKRSCEETGCKGQASISPREIIGCAF